MRKVITYGSFDLFHEGHYRLLKRTKKLGDYLIVGVTTEHYNESRGRLNIIDSPMDRMEHAKRTGSANQIIAEDHVGQKIEDIQKYGADVFTAGSDWIGVFDYLKQYCQMVYLERTRDISSTILRAKNFSLIRLGIIGYGRIAKRMVPEVKYVSGIYVESVYNPKMENTRKFAEANELKFYADNMDEFFNQTGAVYIASPHRTYYGYVRQSLIAGKHVLCKKLMMLSRKEAEELFDLVKEKDCILVEGIKTTYCLGFVRMLNIARSGVIGTIRDVETCFIKLASPILRELMDTQTGGSFTELANYTLFTIIKLLGNNYQEVRFDGSWVPNGVDTYVGAYVKYPYSPTKSKTGLGVKSEGQSTVSGTGGHIKVTIPRQKAQEFEVCYEDISQNEWYFVRFLEDGLRYEISDSVSAMNGFEKDDYKLTAEESIVTAGIMEEFLTMRNNRGETEDEGL